MKIIFGNRIEATTNENRMEMREKKHAFLWFLASHTKHSFDGLFNKHFSDFSEMFVMSVDGQLISDIFFYRIAWFVFGIPFIFIKITHWKPNQTFLILVIYTASFAQFQYVTNEDFPRNYWGSKKLVCWKSTNFHKFWIIFKRKNCVGLSGWECLQIKGVNRTNHLDTRNFGQVLRENLKTYNFVYNIFGNTHI